MAKADISTAEDKNKVCRPAPALFFTLLSAIISITAGSYGLLLLGVVLAIFCFFGRRKDLNWQFLGLAVSGILLVCTPVMREFLIESPKADTMSRRNGSWQGTVIRPALMGTTGWGEAVVRLDEGPLVSVRGKAEYIKAGYRLESEAMLELPSGQRNPGGFDRRSWLRNRAIFLEAELIIPPQIIGKKKTPDAVWQNLLVALQNRAASFFRQYLSSDTVGIITAICLGQKQGLTAQENHAFLESGLVHLVSVSGAHLGFLLLPWRQIGSGSKRSRDIRTLILLLYFGSVTGWRTGVSRASLMLLLRMYAGAKVRHLDELSLLGVTGLILLVLDPFRALQRGFWLSMAATAGIRLGGKPFLHLLGLSARPQHFLTQPQIISEQSSPIIEFILVRINRLLHRLLKLLTITCCAQFACLLPLLFWQNGLNPKAIPINLLAGIPAAAITAGGLSGLFLIGPLIAILPFAGGILINLWSRLLKLPVILLKYLSEQGSGAKGGFIGKGELGKRGQLVIILLLIILITILRLRKTAAVRRIEAIAAIVLLLALIARCLPQPLQEGIWFLDVGQGDCCLIRTADSVILIDGGERDQGYQVVLPFMRNQGITKISTAIVTHGHSDHCGGILDLLEQDLVEQVVVPGNWRTKVPAADNKIPELKWHREQDLAIELISLCNQQKVSILFRQAGDHDYCGDDDTGIAIQYLAPPAEAKSNAASHYLQPDPNRDCLVMKCVWQDFSLLLTADIIDEIERILVRDYGDNLNSMLLKLAHHGSKYSSSIAFLQLVKPVITVVSVGTNRFGHPAQEVLERLSKSGNQMLFRTDKEGAIRLHVDQNKVRISTWLGRRNSCLILN
ncbi:MAG: DUF4131 domain-containing protein [Clostridiales bacterium]|nr:DUF4131 domain-containing protein [Clostridiales bacterium]